MKVSTHSLFFIAICFIISSNSIFAQQLSSQGKTIPIDLFKQDNGFYQSVMLPIYLENVSPFLAYALSWKNSSAIHDVPLYIRFSENGQTWKKWQVVEEGLHTNTDLELTIGELMYADKNNSYYQLKLAQTNPLAQLQIRFFSPGKTIKNEAILINETSEMPSACPCPLPELQTRDMWCATSNCPPHPDPTANQATHLIVHHSAGTNISNDWAAVVRSIWDYHVNSNGWSDIGYNYLVDPNGVLYEGRGDGVLGAHFCGTNTKTMGTCVMGDFTNITPTEEAKMGLVRLLSWNVCDRNINPLDTLFHASSGLDLPRIAGHQDGCATACPGNSFYPLLPEIRETVAAFIDNDCEFLETNIDQLFNNKTVQIFPNPTSDRINIQLENDWIGRLQLEVSTIDGKVIAQQILYKNTNVLTSFFDLKHYESGIYFFKIGTEEGSKNWKIVKE